MNQELNPGQKSRIKPKHIVVHTPIFGCTITVSFTQSLRVRKKKFAIVRYEQKKPINPFILLPQKDDLKLTVMGYSKRSE